MNLRVKAQLWFHVDTTLTMQTLQRSREPVSVLRLVLVSGPITALAAPRRKVGVNGVNGTETVGQLLCETRYTVSNALLQ